MISEGQEKSTGAEWLDGFWGYERLLPPNRIDSILDALQVPQHGRHTDDAH